MKGSCSLARAPRMLQGSGSSVMEMSHRGKEFTSIINKAEADLRQLLSIPDNYEVAVLTVGLRGTAHRFGLMLVLDDPDWRHVLPSCRCCSCRVAPARSLQRCRSTSRSPASRYPAYSMAPAPHWAQMWGHLLSNNAR